MLLTESAHDGGVYTRHNHSVKEVLINGELFFFLLVRGLIVTPILRRASLVFHVHCEVSYNFGYDQIDHLGINLPGVSYFSLSLIGEFLQCLIQL